MKDKNSDNQSIDGLLVSVVVIAYNSEKFVLETLFSIFNQTYQFIELIISDDCSTDNTVLICQNWINKHKHRFVSVKLIENAKNVGIVGNCNKGVEVAKGEWIKLIAGDDIIMDDGIENLLNAILSFDHKIEMLISQQIEFSDITIIDYSNINPRNLDEEIYRPDTKPSKQLKLLLSGKYLLGSAAFYKKSILDCLNGFENKYSNVEDFPFFVKFTFQGNKIHFLETPTILHRRHSKAATSKDKLVPGYIKSINAVKLVYSKKIGNILLIINTLWHIVFSNIIILLGNKGRFLKYLFVFSYVFQPVNYFGFKYLFKKP